jgi:hypothetical protein
MILTERAKRTLYVNEPIWNTLTVDEIADLIVALQVHLEARLMDEKAAQNETEKIENV